MPVYQENSALYRPKEVMRPWNLGSFLPGWQCGVSLDEGLKDFLKIETSL